MKTRIAKIEDSHTSADLHWLLEGFRKYGEPLSPMETKAAQERKSELLRAGK